MKLKPYSEFIIDNADLILNPRNKELALSVAKEASAGAFLSKDRLSLLGQAHTMVKELVEKKKQDDVRKSKLSKEELIFEKYSHREWDEESGPYAAMTFNSFEKAIKEYTKNLQDELVKLRMEKERR